MNDSFSFVFDQDFQICYNTCNASLGLKFVIYITPSFLICFDDKISLFFNMFPYAFCFDYTFLIIVKILGSSQTNFGKNIIIIILLKKKYNYYLFKTRTS